MDDVLHEDGEQRINGRLSPFTCPECHGTLWEVEEAGLVRFRCRVGHAYNMGAMDAAQGTALEAVLWTTLRSLEERAALKRRLAERTRGRSVRMRHRYEHDAAAAEEHAAVVRRLLDEIAAPATADEPIVGGVE